MVWRCRVRYTTALAQRSTAWERCHVSVARSEQEAELKDSRAAFPAYAAVHPHVLQDVLARLQKTDDDFYRRIRQGEKPGFPRFQGRHRYRSFTFNSFTFKEYGNGAHLATG